jgi:hypothetical protein
VRSPVARALVWSVVITVIFGALQTYGIRRQGLSYEKALEEAPFWLMLAPIWFGMILFLSYRRPLQKGVHLAAERATTRAIEAATGRPAPQAACPSCGVLNLTIDTTCKGCGRLLRQIEVVHVLETLPGGTESSSSLLYFGSIVGSLLAGVGGVWFTDAVLHSESDLLLAAGFFVPCIVVLFAGFHLTSVRARKRVLVPRTASPNKQLQRTRRG